MNRRRFISLLALGCPATVVAEKIGLVDRIRSYFFAPIGGWRSLFIAADPGFTTTQCVALQLEKFRDQIPTLFQRDQVFADRLVGLPYYIDTLSSGTFYGIPRSSLARTAAGVITLDDFDEDDD